MSWKKEIEEVVSSPSFRGIAGIVIKDFQSGEVLSINEDKIFPSASLIKLPVLWTLFRKVGSGELSLDETMILEEKDKVEGGKMVPLSRHLTA